MATKASQSPRFQPKPTTSEVVVTGRFALPKSPKRHIKHELNAQLSTSPLLVFSFGKSQKLKEVDLHTPKLPK